MPLAVTKYAGASAFYRATATGQPAAAAAADSGVVEEISSLEM